MIWVGRNLDYQNDAEPILIDAFDRTFATFVMTNPKYFINH